MCRCTTHALYRSKLWQQDHCQHPQNANPDGSTCPGWWKQSFQLRLLSSVWFQVRPHHATSHLRSRLESQLQSVPGCAEECGDPLVQSGGPWQTLDVAAGLGAGPLVQRDPGLVSAGVLRLCTILSQAPLLPRPEPGGLLRLVITNRTSHNTKASRITAGDCGKGNVPSSVSVSRWGLRLKAATLNRC